MIEGAHFYTVCAIFSFAGVLSADLGWVADKNEAGFVAGWLQSSNVCGRIVTSTAWGFVAARYGPKVVLSYTLASLLAGGILFGFCTNLIASMSVRFLFFGLLNGWLVLQGPCALAVAGPQRQTDVLGFIFAAGSGMQLVGPAVGGWTYGLLEEFPALIPSLIGCALALVAVVLFLVVHPAFSKPEPKVRRQEQVKEVESEDSSTSIDSSSRSVLFRWPIPLIIAMRFASGFATFAMYEAVPLWLIADKEVGGLAMTEKSVGSLLCRSGIWNIVYFMWILPKCSKMLGTRAFSILTSGIAAVTAVLLPFSTSVAMANVLHLICASALVSQNALNLAFTNNAAGPEHRVVANGFAVTSETVGTLGTFTVEANGRKAIGPVAFSSLFAWSLQTWGWGGHAMVFCILAALSLMQITCVLLLPSYVGTGQKEAQDS
ncbi:Protein ZINC INDUCED FACILITATOR-LIKE 1 (Protein ZIF-LIKE 1) [Durusdinium trenchii]|uniref:Protein ZINC INDUCED FACILITATOR-LIKE 1 (Protein ZIF-LIKE 1) n=1 Tax=Durusdinium trenchii TaxID=1381693 RepID=A0ABP0NQ52_9DINO